MTRQSFILVLLFAFAATAGSCSNDRELKSRAFKISNRSELIGGPTALGEVGDFMLSNDKVRVVIQDKTFNRGSGVFGGSLIDADLARPTAEGGTLGGNGSDSFGEMFPAFFLEMIDPQVVEVINDGSDGEAAIVEVRGKGGEFVTMLRYLNQLLVNSYKEPVELISELLGTEPPDSDTAPNIEFSTRYILEPGAQHVRVESTLRNISFRDLEMPPQQILDLLRSLAGIDLGDFRLPLGHVLGFGATSSVFVPGLGFDIQQGLLDSLAVPVDLPGFPGHLTSLVGSANSTGVNYGFAFDDDPTNNFVVQRDADGQSYGGRARDGDMLYLFNASGFGGVFSSQSPSILAPDFCNDGNGSPENVCRAFVGECADEVCEADVTECIQAWDSCVESRQSLPSSFTYTNYFIIGDGDVASLWEELYKIRGIETTTVRGQVRDAVTQATVEQFADLLIFERSGSCDDAVITSQVYVLQEGRFELELPPGDYCYQTNGDGRPVGERVPFTVEQTPLFLDVAAESFGAIVARAIDEQGRTVPFKATAVGTHELLEDQTPRQFLVNLSAGDPWRPTDLVPDNEDPNSRKYIEETAYSDHDGSAHLRVRPGTYQLYFSRGIEYEIDVIEVEVAPGATVDVTGELERAIDTTGYLSGDFHLHAFGSIDSGLDNNVRVRSVAGEGVEVAVSTDHNYVTDYKPYILRNGLTEFLNSTVGLELTTFEAGHFNAFPVEFQIDSVSRGSVRWQDISPTRIFDELRRLGNGENVVQVNHPRTPILGYFAQHNVDPFDTSVTLPYGDGTFADVIAAPNGPAFYDVEQLPDGSTEYRSNFSWDFDALEVFNGPHLEELRHFRMPYDKNAQATDPDALPASTFTALKTSILEPFESDADLNAELARFSDQTPQQIEALTEAQRNQLINDYVLSRVPDQYDVICEGDAPSFPGAMDDWYNMLNTNRPDGQYRKYTATGNSDSHGARIDEPGYPRNFFFVGHDRPESFNDEQLVSAVKTQRNIITNGPFVEMFVNGEPIGSDVSHSGPVELRVKIQAARWVGADRFRIVRNGEAVMGLTDDQDTEFWGWIPIDLEDGVYEQTFTIPNSSDAWFVVEVEGDNSLFPVLSPQDIAPFNFADVIGSLAGAFGFGGGIPGLSPDFVFTVTPFAFTNPIWVDADGGGFTAPNPTVFKCSEGLIAPNALLHIDPEVLRTATEGRLRSATIEHEHHVNPLQRPKGEHRDVRMLFEAFGGHAH